MAFENLTPVTNVIAAVLREWMQAGDFDPADAHDIEDCALDIATRLCATHVLGDVWSITAVPAPDSPLQGALDLPPFS